MKAKQHIDHKIIRIQQYNDSALGNAMKRYKIQFRNSMFCKWKMFQKSISHSINFVNMKNIKSYVVEEELEIGHMSTQRKA